LAYASTYDVLRDYFFHQGITKINSATITGIISGSEMLFDHTREMMRKVFNCPVYSRYSNQENGILGQDEDENNTFILNEASYIIEIFDMNGDHPINDGEIGRIVVTDLYNYAMPMIRYDTGDIGSIAYRRKNGIMKKCITNFGGRKVDVVYDSHGQCLSPHFITNKLWEFSEVKQFQFIQDDKDKYTIKINIEGDFTRRNEMEEMLITILGKDAKLNVEFVDEIPVLASGKRNYIVNEYSPLL